MQEHPIPRQITTFEFKLIGELTVHQFIYLAFGSVIALILYFAVPAILYINIAIAAIPALLGVGFAFVPVNDRPMDIWLKNLIRRLTSPTQYYFHKNNSPPKLMLGITLPPREIMQQHLLAQQKLHEYLQNKTPVSTKVSSDAMDKSFEDKKKKIQGLILDQRSTVNDQPSTIPSVAEVQPSIPLSVPPIAPSVVNEQSRSAGSFTVRGEVYAGTGLPLPNILAYIKQNDKIIRLFKTDVRGVFANNLPIPKGDYVLYLEDPRKKYTFDTMKVDGTLPNIVVFAHKTS